MTNGMVAVAFALTLTGVGMLERFHARQNDFIADYWAAPELPGAAPRCRFDCSPPIPRDIELEGALGYGMVAAGPFLLLLKWALKRK